MKRAMILAMVFVVAALAGTGTASADGSEDAKGAWVNDLPCAVPDPTGTGPAEGGTHFRFTCSGTTFWHGSFTGRTVLNVTASMDLAGNMKGTATEWFYGLYSPDNTIGGLFMTHAFTLDGRTGVFVSEMSLVRGTCAFAGAAGGGTFTGNSLFGGYTITWSRAAGAASAPSTCNPVE